MFENAADIIQTELRDTGIVFPGKERFPIFPDALVRVHPRSGITEERLRHEGHRLAMSARYVFDDVLVQHHLVCGSQKGIKSDIDFGLTGRGCLVMMLFDLDTDLFHFQDHLAPDILLGIGRSHGEIPLLMPNLPPQIDPLLPHVPGTFLRVDIIEAAVAGLVVTGMIEDEKFGFRPPE